MNTLVEPTAAADEAFVMPASVSQKRFWLLEQMSPGNTALDIPIAFELDGPLDVAVLEQALQSIVDRHEILRTRFELIDGEPRQLILAHAKLTLEHLEAPLRAGDRAARIRHVLDQEAKRPVDFNRAPLLRAALLVLSPEDHVLLLTAHHIISDGWSNGILIRELAAFYDAGRRKIPPALPPLAIQYADYVVWQEEWLKTPDYQAQLEYWRGQLAGDMPALDLPTDFPRETAQPVDAVLEARLLHAALTEALKRLGQEEGVTLFMIFLTAYVALLHRYTGQSRLVLGTTAANRNKPELEALIGLFANLLVLPAKVDAAMTFRDLLARQRDQALGGFAHHEAPFELVLQDAGAGRVPLQTHFLFQRAFMQPAQAGELAFRPLHSVSPGSTFELTFGIVERAEGIRLQMEYRTCLYRRETVTRLLEHFEQVLEAAAAHPETPLAELPLFAENEREEIEARLAMALHGLPVCSREEAFADLDQQLEAHWLTARETFAPIRVPAGVALAAMDDHQRVAPLDVVGRLAIALPGARTPEPTPFLGRNTRDGIELWGREADLVRLKGFRFNRRVVEVHLRAHPRVDDAACVVGSNGRLIAHVRLRGEGSALSGTELRDWLKGRVSDLLLPASIRLVSSLSRTAHGEWAIEEEPEPASAVPRETGAVPLQALVQQQLLEIWKRLLNTADLSIESNFFEVGGTSFLALRMMLEAEKLARQPLPLSLLLRGATVRDLARHILEGVNAKDADVISVQPGGTRPPFFFLHGDWIGGGFYCNRLAHDLGSDQPFYALPPYHMRDERIVSMREMAAHHVTALRRERPHGPYLVGGYCIGAAVAIEVARQLVREGETVEHLLLVDPPLWGGVVLAWLWPWIDRLGDRRGWNLERKIAFFDRTAVAATRWWRKPLRAKFATVLNRLDLKSGAAGPASSVPAPEEDDGAQILDGLDFSTYYMTHRLHRLAALDVPATLFLPATTVPSRRAEAPRLSRLALDRVRVEIVPGNHTTCITQHTAELAEGIRRAAHPGSRELRATAESECSRSLRA